MESSVAGPQEPVEEGSAGKGDLASSLGVRFWLLPEGEGEKCERIL